jgi:hypothetical protein
MALEHNAPNAGALLTASPWGTAAAQAHPESSAASRTRLNLAGSAIRARLASIASATWRWIVEARMAQARREIALVGSPWRAAPPADATDERPQFVRYY